MINLLIFFKGSSIFIKWDIYKYKYIFIYIYIYVKGHVFELAPSYTQSVLGFKGENIQIAGVDGLYIYI